MNDNLCGLSAIEIADGVKAGRFSAEEVVQACLERIEKREDEVMAWEFIDPDIALSQARKLDEASDLLDEEIKLFNYDSNAAFSQGLLLKQKKNYTRALKEFEKARREEPDKYESWKFSSECMQKLKDLEGLKNLYTEAMVVRTKKDRAWLHTLIVKNIAELNSNLRPEHETLRLYLQKDPENAILRYALASALETAGDLSGAYKSFEIVATSDYSHIQANAWFRMALLAPLDQKNQLLKQCLKQQSSHQGAINLLKNNAQIVALPIQESHKNTEKIKTNHNP